MLRNYENIENTSVQDFYVSLYSNQSLEKERELREKYSRLNHGVMTMQTALNLLDTFIDPSDPDLDVPNSVHAYQTAERIRMKYPNNKQLQITGLIHDIGKVLFNFGEPNYFIVGDTYVLGAQIPNTVPYYHTIENPNKYAEYGIYKPHCGLENLTLSWGHDEYLYTVLMGNREKHKLEKKYMDIIRYHSFYPWHSREEYKHLLQNGDSYTLCNVKMFNQFDLYSKPDSKNISAGVKNYYKKLITEIFPQPLNW